MMDRLKNKRALITGGVSGIGLETARRFLKEGARVAITGRNLAALEAAHQELGNDVLIMSSDASDVSAQAALAQSIGQAFECFGVRKLVYPAFEVGDAARAHAGLFGERLLAQRRGKAVAAQQRCKCCAP